MDVRFAVVIPLPLPLVRIPDTVEVSWEEEIYPIVPSPSIVDVRFIFVRDPVPLVRIPETVEVSWEEEIYPAEPRPIVVLCMGVDQSCRMFLE